MDFVWLEKNREMDLFDFTFHEFFRLDFFKFSDPNKYMEPESRFIINLKILGVSTDELSAEVGAKEAWELIESRRNFFELYHGEYYAMMNLIRLLDGMVGNDPLIDFNGKNYKDVTKIKNYLEEYRNTLVKSQVSSTTAGNNTNDELKLRELLSLTLSKWERLRSQYTCITKMVKPKKSSSFKQESVSPKKVKIQKSTSSPKKVKNQKSSPEKVIEKQTCKRCKNDAVFKCAHPDCIQMFRQILCEDCDKKCHTGITTSDHKRERL